MRGAHMKERPDTVIKRKWFGRNNISIVFRRFNLSVKDFKKTDTGYIYVGSFKRYGVSGKIYLFVDSENFNDIFKINSKTIKVKGSANQFDIYIRFSDQIELPLVKYRSNGCLKCELHCEGERLYYEGKKKRRGEYWSGIHSTSKGRTYAVPSSTSWAASHPYQGGGFSPR